MRTDCSVRAVAVHKQSAYIVKMGLIMTSSPYLIETLVLILHLVFRVGISDKYVFRCSYFYRTEKTGIPVGNEVKYKNELLEVKLLHGVGWEVLPA